MKPWKKEIFFLLILLMVSLLSMEIPGVYIPGHQSVSPINENIAGSNDLKYGIIDRTDENDIVFKSGIAYLMKNGYHSDFYNGNISLFPTSVYWKFPKLENDALLIGKNEPNGFVWQLHLADRNNFPVVSLVINPDDFFGFSNGIYTEGEESFFSKSAKFYPFPWHRPANFFNRENDKRKIHFTFYNKNGKAEYSSLIYAEISGNATRCFPQKSLRITASKDFGSKKIKYDFFKNNKKYKNLVLRNGGNDNTKSFFRDMLMQTLMSGSGLDIASFLPCEMYLNGQYWGVHILQNRMDANFISEKYNVKEKNVTIVEGWEFKKGDEKKFIQLKKHISGKNEKLNYSTACEFIDMENLITYLVAQMYFTNTDWPDNNLKMYKISGKKETKWRFAFFDLDYGFGYTGKKAFQTDMFAFLNDKNDPFSALFKILMKDKVFRAEFKKEFERIMKDRLLELNMINQINQLEKEFLPVMEKHTARWQKLSSVKEWKEAVQELREFAENRNEVLKKHIEIYLE